MRFSGLTQEFPGETNRLYTRLGELRSHGVSVTDMVRGNPNDLGVAFPEELLRSILAEAQTFTRTYNPDSLGQRVARQAVADFYDTPRVSADHIVLTPGTSLSYWYAFKLLCDPGDSILCPVPSYPLFDYIARLAGIRLSHYRLDEDHGWQIDLEHLESQVDPRTRAMILISPHNPTGMVATRDQVERLGAIASRHRLAIISDEVFWSFAFNGTHRFRPLETGAPLVVTLNGLSKMYALPALKLGWMTVSGEEASRQEVMRTLELISDTFLPVNEIVQFALPAIFREGATFLKDYKQRVALSRATTLEILGSYLRTVPAGGFHVVVPCVGDEEAFALDLLEHDHLLVHPGYFYDIDGDHIVFSFLKDATTLRALLSRIHKRLQS